MALKETIRKAEKEKAYIRRYGLKLNIHTDADIIARLDDVPSMQGYIKKLIRADIAAEDVATCENHFETKEEDENR